MQHLHSFCHPDQVLALLVICSIRMVLVLWGQQVQGVTFLLVHL